MMIITKTFALIVSMLLATSVLAEGDERNGRYHAIYNPEGALWIFDTKTGDVKFCVNEGETTPPSCTGWTKNVN